MRPTKRDNPLCGYRTHLLGRIGADGREFERRLARSWPRRCNLTTRLKTTVGPAPPGLDCSIWAGPASPPTPKLERSGPPEGPRPSCLRLPRRSREQTKAPPRVRPGGASIQFRRLLLRATNRRVFRLIFIVLEIDQPAIRDRGDARRGLPGYSCFAGCRPSHRNQSVIMTVRRHNDLAGGRGRRNGHQSGSRGAMSAKRTGVMFLLPIFLKWRGLNIRSLVTINCEN